jgi:tetratricopeptide (TPR) repeat protein
MNNRIFSEFLRGVVLAGLVLVYANAAWSEQNAVSKETFEVLKQVDALLRQGQAERAQQQLAVLQSKIGQSDSFDKAVIQQYFAYAYTGTGNQRAALLAATDAINSNKLDAEAVQGLKLLAGQAAFRLENYRKSAMHLEKWLQKAPGINADIYYMAGYAAFRAGMTQSAILHLEKAAALQKEPSKDVVQLLLSLYIDQKNYAKAEPLVKKMVMDTPQKREWWLYLSGLYVQQDRLDHALASMMLAYYIGEVRQSDVMQLISLNAQQGLPTKAARLLQTELDNKRIPRNYRNLKLLYSCWQLAREYGHAAQILSEAANLAPDGEDFLVLGRLSMQRDDWVSAKSSFQKGLRKGGLKRTHRARLLLGIAALNTEDEVLARQILEPLLEIEAVKREAGYWLRRLDRRKNADASQYHAGISTIR